MTKLDDILGLGDLDTKELERIALGQALRRAAEGKDGPPSTPLGAEATSPADHEKPTVMGQVPDLDAFQSAMHGADGEKVTVIATAGMTPAKAGPLGEMPTVQASQAVLKDIRAEALAALEAQGVDIRAPVQEHTMPLTPKPMPAAKPALAKAEPAKAAPVAVAVPAVASPPVAAAPAKDPAKTTMQVKAAPRKRGVGGTILVVMVGLVAVGAASGAVVFGMRAQKAQQAAASTQTPTPKENKDDAVSFSATKGKPVDVPVATVATAEAKPEAKPDEAKPPATATEPEPKPPTTVAAAIPEPPKADPKKEPPKATAALPPPTPPPTIAKAEPPKADPPKKPVAVAAKADPPPAAPPPAAPPPQPAKPSVDSLLQQQLNSAIP